MSIKPCSVVPGLPKMCETRSASPASVSALYVSGSGALRPPPPVVAPLARSLRTPSRGDPPRGRFAQSGREAPTLPACEAATPGEPNLCQRAKPRPLVSCGAALTARASVTLSATTTWRLTRYRLGEALRGGSPREGVRSELASAATTGGGGRSAPDPDAS